MMNIFVIAIKLVGSLGLFLYGMQILSEGIQKAAGDKLKRTLNMMTGNSFAALLTGLGVTAIIQSSSATTVMVVSFVNAGLLTVVQAAGVIFGANIGTTVTAWIVSLIGFDFQISAMALPMIGIGFILMTSMKKRQKLKNYGEAMLGFGLLFLGLDFLSHSIPKPSEEVINALSAISDMGLLSILIAVLTGTLLTIIVHSSSASTAIVITLAVEGVIDFNISAGLVLGCNIGTTIDAFLASIGSNTNAKRAAWIHILFNVFGTIWAVVFFTPFITLVNLLASGTTIAQHIAMLHTVFNVVNAILFTPFTKQFANFVSKFIKAKPSEDNMIVKLEYVTAPLVSSPELNMMRARKEIADLAGICGTMFSRWAEILQTRPSDLSNDVEHFKNLEDYADQMRDGLSGFLLECASHEIGTERQKDIGAYLRIVVDLENITDDCFRLILLLEKANSRKLGINQTEVESLIPYSAIVKEFLEFMRQNINGHISKEQLAIAHDMENNIDEYRAVLRKKAKKRLQQGADVKSELLFIDIIRHVEKIGDHSYGVAQALQELRK